MQWKWHPIDELSGARMSSAQDPEDAPVKEGAKEPLIKKSFWNDFETPDNQGADMDDAPEASFDMSNGFRGPLAAWQWSSRTDRKSKRHSRKR